MNKFTPSRQSNHEWPFPEVYRAWQAGDYRWHEVDKKIFDTQFTVVPPAMTRHSVFAVGEAWKSGKHGPLHAIFYQYGDRYFCRVDYLKKFSEIRYATEIRKQIG